MLFIDWGFHRVWPWLLVAACLMGNPTIAADGSASRVHSIIANNALLDQINRADPATARRFASEIERQIASLANDGKVHGQNDAPELRFRGTLTRPDGAPDEDILRTNREDFDANPALKRLYQYSPLASLRMLTRLREAADKLKR